jgi:hypothetical protein
MFTMNWTTLQRLENGYLKYFGRNVTELDDLAEVLVQKQIFYLMLRNLVPAIAKLLIGTYLNSAR